MQIRALSIAPYAPNGRKQHLHRNRPGYVMGGKRANAEQRRHIQQQRVIDNGAADANQSGNVGAHRS